MYVLEKLLAFVPMLGPYLRATQALVVVLTLGIVIVLLWVQRRTASTVHRALSLVTRAAGIPTFRQTPHLEDEVARARRYQYQITVLVAKLQPGAVSGKDAPVVWNSARDSGGPEGEYMLAFPFVACMLRDTLRNGDMISYDIARDRLVIVLLHLGKADAASCVRRFQKSIEDRTGLKPYIGMAEFPTDGYTIDDIVEKARAAADYQQATEQSPVTQLKTVPIRNRSSAAREAM